MQLWAYIKRFFSHFFIPGEHNAHRPRILHRPWLIFFLAITLATEGFLVSNLVARQSDQQFLAAVVPAEVIALTNTERADNSVGNLTEDALLDSAAQAKANDMAQAGYFSHTGPDGKTPWQWIQESGYQYQYAGENLAVRFIDSSEVVNAWMASPSHRANIVKPVYTQIGVGVALGTYQGQPATYVVQYFGTPKSAQAAAAAAVQPAAPVATEKPVAEPAGTPAVAGASDTNTKPIATPKTPPNNSAEVAAAVTPSTEPVPTEAVHSASFTQNVVKQLVRAFGEPKESSNLLLSFIGSLLLVALAITFFMHYQIQHTNMLMAGAFVAFLAFFFVGLNTQLVSGPPNSQSASVATAQHGVLISTEAAETGYALFPN